MTEGDIISWEGTELVRPMWLEYVLLTKEKTDGTADDSNVRRVWSNMC